MRCLLARVRPFALVAGFGGAVFALGLAMTIDRGFGEDVRLISPHDASTVQVNRALYAPGDTVAEIYGNPLSKSVRSSSRYSSSRSLPAPSATSPGMHLVSRTTSDS